MNTVFIYALKDPVTDKIRYVGKSKAPKERLRKHLNSPRERTHRIHWIRSLQTQGLKPVLEIIDEVPVEEWPQWEVAYIQYYIEEGCSLVNGSLGGEGGHSPSEETRRKISEANKGKHFGTMPLEVRKKIQQAFLGDKNHFFGKHHSSESRQRMSRSHTGKTFSEERRRKISERTQGEKNPNFGNRYSAEIREKIRQSRLGKKASEETRRKLSEAQRRRWAGIRQNT